MAEHKVPKVFISYSQEDPDTAKSALSLAKSLREDYGIDCMIDKYKEATEKGKAAETWRAWISRMIREADFIGVVCDESYFKKVTYSPDQEGKGKGVKYEAHLIFQEVYQEEGKNKRIVPILLNPDAVKFLPSEITGFTHFIINTNEGYKKLQRCLLGEVEYELPKLGALKFVGDAKPIKKNSFLDAN